MKRIAMKLAARQAARRPARESRKLVKQLIATALEGNIEDALAARRALAGAPLDSKAERKI